jgi:hypothetical protein
METPSIDTNDDPRVWEQKVALLKGLHIFISENLLILRNILELLGLL